MARRGSADPSRKARRGELSEEDRILWAEVARSVTPMHGQKRLRATTTLSAPVEPPPPAPARASRKVSAPPPAPSGLGRKPTEVGRPEPGLDRRTSERLRRGEREPDARLDLHGMTADRAHARLDRFIGEALARGYRMVLVITGKGRPARDNPNPDVGLLRGAVPGWLRAGPHGSRILGIYQAHRRHGGEGALYVYLRRIR